MTTPLIEDELKTKDFNRITDKYFETGKISAEQYATLTPRQMDCIQWAKRAFNRVHERWKRHEEEFNSIVK